MLGALGLRRAETTRGLWFWTLATGLMIAVSALARPAANLLWIPLGLWILCARQDKRVIAAILLMLFALLGVGAWRSHIYATFGHRDYTTLGNWNLLYKRAASVLHHAEAIAIDEALGELARRVELGLGNDPTDVDAMKRHEHYVGSPQLQSAMTQVAVDVFAAHPLWYLLTFLAGLYRQLFQTTGPLSLPGVYWSVALLSAAGYGLLRILRERRWALAAFLTLPCVYFLMGSLVYCTACSAGRDRATVMPVLAVMAAYGVMRLVHRRKDR